MNKIETKNDLRNAITAKILDFVDLLKKEDKPSGEVAARAKALADYFIDAAQYYAEDQAFKAVGECKYCYGKGYSSVLEPAHVAKADFIGDKDHVVKPSRMEYRFCQCERGQALKHLIISNAPFVID